MLQNPNALIGDPDAMDAYAPQGPGELPSTSAQEIRSGLTQGPKFATVDKQAWARLQTFCEKADAGIREYVYGAANSESGAGAKESGRIYMNADVQSKARFEEITTPVNYGSVPGGR